MKPPAGVPPMKEVVDDIFKKMATESIRRYRTATSDGVPYPMIVGPKTLEILRQMDGWRKPENMRSEIRAADVLFPILRASLPTYSMKQ